MSSNEGLRHVAGYSMLTLYVDESLLSDERLTLVDAVVAAYDEQNETPWTSDSSCAEYLGIAVEEVTESRNKLTSLGDFTVEDHRKADLTEEEYYV